MDFEKDLVEFFQSSQAQTQIIIETNDLQKHLIILLLTQSIMVYLKLKS